MLYLYQKMSMESFQLYLTVFFLDKTIFFLSNIGLFSENKVIIQSVEDKLRIMKRSLT